MCSRQNLKIIDQGRMAQFSMLIKARNLDLPIDIQTKLQILIYSAMVKKC